MGNMKSHKGKDVMRHTTSGYCDCACRDCFDLAIASVGDEVGKVFCHDCEAAGCYGVESGDADCQRDDAYGVEEGET